MKKYLYSTAYFVVVGLLFATLLIMVPVQIMAFAQGDKGFVSILQSIIIFPFIAAVAGSLLAGIPVVLTGFSMAYFNRLSMPIFIIATVLVGIVLEFIYCQLLSVKADYIPIILTVTAVTTLFLCFSWRLWIDPKISD
ncbi:hypothetical protein [Entomomonas asaccharolytica]|uniref:Uncharacterized protein n=1 Tax=Entomomonas asaccharolytica TaxID=2785331 RepID=A0A974NE54_9GAMM|nr:hypothetical protein [Entomomonas asaccharolytica]QQP84737.1 hypothetical protein JHT90_09995 [Entomomonas asaccharolytica]